MTLALIFVLLAAAALAGVFYFAREGAASGKRELQRVDIEAFKNLMDPAERAFLQRNLPARDFRALHRQRQLAALEYIAAVSGNASALLILAQEARRSPDSEVVQAATAMIENATQLRLDAATATFRIYLGLLVPSWAVFPGALADHYDRLTRLGLRLEGLCFRDADSLA